MKRIVFIILSVFCFMNTVRANEWQDEYIEGENVDIEHRYRFYKEVKEGEYLNNDIDNKYLYEDINDVKYEENIEYNTNCNEKGNKVSTYYEYEEVLDVKYIKIINQSENSINYTSMDIIDINTNESIEYEIYNCTDCNEDYTIINPDGEIIFELEDYYSFRDIEFLIDFIVNRNNSSSSFRLMYGNKDTFYITDTVASIYSLIGNLKFDINDSFKIYENYKELETGYDISVDKLIHVIKQEDVCKTNEKMTYHYNIKREYYDDNYYSDISSLVNLTKEERELYQKDTEDYKVFYRYKEKLNLVKTGIEDIMLNYKYLAMYILGLILMFLIIVKYLKRMSNENNN